MLHLQGHLLLHGGGGLMFSIVGRLVFFSLYVYTGVQSFQCCNSQKLLICSTIFASRYNSGQSSAVYYLWVQILLRKPLCLSRSQHQHPSVSVDWVQLEQTARGTHKRNLSAYREEGYRVTMETDGPTPVADGGGEGIGGWVRGWRDPKMIISPGFPS